MRTSGVFALALALSAAFVSAPAAAKGKKAARAAGGAGPAPTASPEEVNKLKRIRFDDPKAGLFTWGLRPDQVIGSVKSAVEAKYKKRMEAAAQDPGKQQRIKEERDKEIAAMQKSFIKFDGTKSGWDVSIIGPEFAHGTGESMVIAKEDMWTRYFFFADERLYKMVLAFNKEVIGTKSFQEFGKDMEARFGNSQEVFRDEKTKGGVRHVLDHFAWSAHGDQLKLVDRSEFYGVYCLVLAEGATNERVLSLRKSRPQSEYKDPLVEAVARREQNERDSNDNIIDRVVGKQIIRPGDEQKHGNIVVRTPGVSRPESGPVRDDAISGDPDSKPAAKKAKPAPSSKKGSDLGLEL